MNGEDNKVVFGVQVQIEELQKIVAILIASEMKRPTEPDTVKKWAKVCQCFSEKHLPHNL